MHLGVIWIVSLKSVVTINDREVIFSTINDREVIYPCLFAFNFLGNV
jgi:hypothetical protein